MTTENNLDCEFYCLSWNNPERKENMKKLFNKLDIPIHISNGVSYDDARLNYPNINKRVWSCMFGHMDLIEEFYMNSKSNYAVICEDDILIRKDFKSQLNKIIADFQKMRLDVLLLGYLCNHEIIYLPRKMCENIVSDNFPFQYYDYSDYKNNLWGAQMYMISKSYAEYLINNYNLSYALISENNSDLQPFSSDHIITKAGNSALIYPLMAIENGDTEYQDLGQHIFHKGCFQFHFNPNDFVNG